MENCSVGVSEAGGLLAASLSASVEAQAVASRARAAIDNTRIITALLFDDIAGRSLIAVTGDRLRLGLVHLVQLTHQDGLGVVGDLHPVRWRLQIAGAGRADQIGSD